jgi:multidrug efflux pump subunit AcrB
MGVEFKIHGNRIVQAPNPTEGFMTLSDISIKKPVFAWMLMAVLILFGSISYLTMGISQLPDVDFPVVTVTVPWAGASPDVMESAVADIIESAVMSVDLSAGNDSDHHSV